MTSQRGGVLEHVWMKKLNQSVFFHHKCCYSHLCVWPC